MRQALVAAPGAEAAFIEGIGEKPGCKSDHQQQTDPAQHARSGTCSAISRLCPCGIDGLLQIVGQSGCRCSGFGIAVRHGLGRIIPAAGNRCLQLGDPRQTGTVGVAPEARGDLRQGHQVQKAQQEEQKRKPAHPGPERARQGGGRIEGQGQPGAGLKGGKGSGVIGRVRAAEARNEIRVVHQRPSRIASNSRSLVTAPTAMPPSSMTTGTSLPAESPISASRFAPGAACGADMGSNARAA